MYCLGHSPNLYDDGLSTSHCSLPIYGGKPGGNLVKTTPAIAGATSRDSLIYLRVDRRTRSRERYIEVGLESALATTKPSHHWPKLQKTKKSFQHGRIHTMNVLYTFIYTCITYPLIFHLLTYLLLTYLFIIFLF